MSVPTASSADGIYKVRIESINGRAVADELWYMLTPGEHLIGVLAEGRAGADVVGQAGAAGERIADHGDAIIVAERHLGEHPARYELLVLVHRVAVEYRRAGQTARER